MAASARTSPARHPRAASRWLAGLGSPLGIVVVLAVLMRLPLLLVPGYAYDMLIFREWTTTIVEEGLLAALYRPEMNYIGYAYILGALGWMRAQFVDGSPLGADAVLLQLMKLPGILSDFGVAWVLYRLPARLAPRAPTDASQADARVERPAWLVRVPLAVQTRAMSREQRLGLAAAALYLLNPATLYTSAYWGQIDSMTALAMVGAVSCLIAGRPGWAAAALTTGFVMKPQPIVLVPLVLWLAWRWGGWPGVGRSVLGSALTFGAAFGYFWANGALPRIGAIYELLFETGTQISVSAMNLWWIVYRGFGDIRPHDHLLALGGIEVTPSRISQALIMLAGAWLLGALGWRPTPRGALLGGAFLALCFFVLPMKMHERYLFPLFALLAPVAVLHARWLTMYVLLSLTYTLNMFAVLPIPPYPDQTRWAFGPPLDVAVSLAHVALLLAFAAMLMADGLRDRRAARLGAPPQIEAVAWPRRGRRRAELLLPPSSPRPHHGAAAESALGAYLGAPSRQKTLHVSERYECRAVAMAPPPAILTGWLRQAAEHRCRSKRDRTATARHASIRRPQRPNS